MPCSMGETQLLFSTDLFSCFLYLPIYLSQQEPQLTTAISLQSHFFDSTTVFLNPNPCLHSLPYLLHLSTKSSDIFRKSLQKPFPLARPLTKHLFQTSSGPTVSSHIAFPIPSHGLCCSGEKEHNPSLRCGLFIRCWMSCTFLISYLSAAALCSDGWRSCTLALGQALHHPRGLIAMLVESLESGFPFSRVLLGSLHSSAPLSCVGVNELLFVQLFEDEKCNGRALLLLPCMKSSVPNPTVLCLATGCHSCSTHNAAEIRKEKCLPSSGQQPHFQSHYLFRQECLFVKGLGVFSCVYALLVLIFRQTEKQLCFLCMLLHWEIRSKMNTFMEGGADMYKILITQHLRRWTGICTCWQAVLSLNYSFFIPPPSSPQHRAPVWWKNFSQASSWQHSFNPHTQATFLCTSH